MLVIVSDGRTSPALITSEVDNDNRPKRRHTRIPTLYIKEYRTVENDCIDE